MKSRTTVAVAEPEAQNLFITDCWSDLRYQVMRAARLATMLALEISMAVWFWFGLRSLGFGIGKAASPENVLLSDAWYWKIAWANPWLSLAAAVVAFCVCFGLVFAIGTPYAYQSAPPIVSTRRCHSCHSVIPDQLNCRKCGAIRVAWFVTKALWAFGLVLSALHFVNDMTIMLAGAFLMRKPK